MTITNIFYVGNVKGGYIFKIFPLLNTGITIIKYCFIIIMKEGEISLMIILSSVEYT